ncbi:hypothetical protein YTPLAS18_20380 [Nitrospira sp.]|nr:hypothetical protein YTPLAS18_20380 [Nitrospira sp.]
MPAGSPSELPLSPKAQQLAREWAQNPQSKVFVPLAEEYARLGMLQRAAMVLEEGISIYPGYVVAMVALGAVYFDMKEFESAKDVLEAAIQSSPENMKAHRVLAQIYAGDGNVECARKSCTVVLMTNPLDEEIKDLERTLGKSAFSPPTPSTLATPRQQSGRRRHDRHDVQEQVSGIPSATEEANPASRKIPALTSGQELPRVSPHAKQIARLERWLTRIQTSRRAVR